MDYAARLRDDARRANERRVLVLSGTPERTREQATDVVDAIDVDPAASRYVGSAETLPCERVDPDQTSSLLGTTQQCIVLDCHDACRPNAIGRAVGAVDGGGLTVFLTPPLAEWPDRRDGFDETLAVPPFERADVAGNFRRRLVETLREHRGIAIVDAETGDVQKNGILDHAPRPPRPPTSAPTAPRFPPAAYEACLTQDQADTVETLEQLCDIGQAVVVEADRGRGKSSAAGLAAASLALDGWDVLVTAPQYESARELFARAMELLTDLGELAGRDREEMPHCVETETGRVRFARPVAAAELPEDPDCVLVDEAAALPVRLLERYLSADSVAFTTTIHGYEGAGRGFSVRFRDRLAEGDHTVSEQTLADPIRYAAADPIEVWSFRALCLDARPAVAPVVEDATPESVTYREFDPAELSADENLLREVFGLLVLAHYRTEPNDLARLLDAPNVSVRALCQDGHVVSVALLAREGTLDAETRANVYQGERIRGNMIPDVLTSQLRDEQAGEPVGYRVLRIATHQAVRSRGLGSRLLDVIREEVADEADWLGVGYGATPPLLRFWADNDFSTVHLSTTRNDRSGEHSAVMLDPLTEAGDDLHNRHAGWFLDRLPSMLTDPLDGVDPDVVRATVRSTDRTLDPALSEWEWRVVAGILGGVAIFDTCPRAVRRLALAGLLDNIDGIDAGQERLLVRKVLQAQPWDEVAAELDYHSSAQCKRALVDAVEPLVDHYADPEIRQDLARFY